MDNEMYVFPAKKFQITTPSSSPNLTLTSIAWMWNRGYVAVSGTNGVVRIMLLNLDSDKERLSTVSSNPPWYSSFQMTGHESTNKVKLLCWNEVYQKLASADDEGTIIVWVNQAFNETWCDEMTNNRNKSTVACLKWSNDGKKIAIVYEDGQLIIGSVEGNRLWNKDMNHSLSKVEWSGDDSMLLLGLANGEVHAYDENGKFLTKIPILCIDHVEIETHLTKDLKKDSIVAMSWYAPTKPCIVPIIRRVGEQGSPNTYFTTGPSIDSGYEEPFVFRGQIPEDRPRFFIAYQNGNIQLMCDESNMKNVSIIRLPSTIIIAAKWAPNGQMFAVAGYQTDLPELERNVLHFISAYGQCLQSIRLPFGNFTDISWESSGFRLGALIDLNIYLILIKIVYKWGYFGKTFVYAFKCPETLQEMVIFYETSMEVKTKRYLDNICCIKTFGDYCVIVFRTNEIGGAYTMQICDGIGTPVDSQSTNITPEFVTMNGNVVVVANSDSFIVWEYSYFGGFGNCKKGLTKSISKMKLNGQFDNSSDSRIKSIQKIYYINQNNENNIDENVERESQTINPICAICAGSDFILISLESGSIYRYSLPDVEQQCVFNNGIPSAKILALNCSGTRLALVNKNRVLKFFDTKNVNTLSVVPNFENKDVWCVQWDMEKDDTLAIMEKQRLIIVCGIVQEEPILNIDRICQFQNLTVRTVLLDEVFKKPEEVNKSLFVDIEVKLLKTVKNLLAIDKIDDAIKLIEKNNHPKLWDILVKAALKKMNFKVAEHAFVKLQDYGGIQFIKRLKNIQSNEFKKAEIHVFFGEFEAAEKIYFENDRRDLAIDMLKKMHDWFRIQQILQTTAGSGDDILVAQVWKHVGDYYMERQNWKAAVKYYEHSDSYAELAKCYLMLDDFAQMEELSNQLSDDNPVLNQLAEIFTNYGLCDQAVSCFLRCNKINEAFDTCIQLNKWDKAFELSEKYKLADVKSLLNNYASQIAGNKSKNLAVAQLYRKAANYLQAAKVVYKIADDECAKQANPLRLKKLYVMAALLIEDHHVQNQQKLAKNKNETSSNASIALEDLLNNDQNLSIEDSKLINNAWRKAEAYHFFMLSSKQIYQGQYEASLKTALAVLEYEDLLEPVEIYSFLALVSYLSGYFGICSKAFMKLESLPTLSSTEQDIYAKLAMQIFMKNQPRDDKATKTECTNCNISIMDHTLVCPNLNCNTHFPICIASGRPLHAYQFWLCPSCKHKAYKQEMQSRKFCPLCHYDISI